MSRYKKTDPKPTIEWLKANPEATSIKKSKLVKPEIVNHSTVELGLRKNRTIDEILDEEQFMLFPDKETWRRRLCYSLYEWADREDSIEITQFCREYKLPRQTLYDYIHKYPDVKKVFDEIKLWLGSKKRIGALKRYYDKDVAFKDMYKYDPEWLEIDRYNQSLKADSDQGQVINVYLPDIKKSDEVPMLEERGIQPEMVTEAIETKGVDNANI